MKIECTYLIHGLVVSAPHTHETRQRRFNAHNGLLPEILNKTTSLLTPQIATIPSMLLKKL